jgi:site-specific DNA recombinase
LTRESGNQKRCAIYMRVSTEMQVDRSSLSTQEAQLQEYARHQGWTVVKLLTDAGLSAKDTRRPAFQEMVKLASEGKIDVILVSKLDRVSRNLRDLLELVDNLKTWGVDFVSASQSFDTTKPAGSLMLNILGGFAQFEREITAERVRENMIERAKSGAWSGGQTPFGYSLNTKTKALEVESAEAEIVKFIFAEFLKTRSIRKTIFAANSEGCLNREGKPWARTSVGRLLRNEVYVGTICYAKRITRGSRILPQERENWVVVYNACEAIVDRDDFLKVQAELGGRTRLGAWRESSPHLLSGLVRCGICGCRMTGTTTGRKNMQHRYYRCPQHMQKGPTVCEGVACRAEELESAIIGHITGFDARTLKEELKCLKEQLARETAPREKRRAKLEAELERFRERELRLVGLYEEAIIDVGMYRERRGEIEKERLAVARELADVEVPAQGAELDEIDVDALAERFGSLQDAFHHLTLYEKQRLLRATVSEIRLQADGTADVDLNLLAGLEGVAIPLNECLEIDLGGGPTPVQKRKPMQSERRETILKAPPERDAEYAQAAS